MVPCGGARAVHNGYGARTRSPGHEGTDATAGVAGMKRRTVDAVAGLLVALVLVTGGWGAWQALGRSGSRTGTHGSMMDSGSMGMTQGPDAVWTLLATVTVAAVVGGGYLVARESLLASVDAEEAAGAPSSDDHAAGTGGVRGETDSERGEADTEPEETRDGPDAAVAAHAEPDADGTPEPVAEEDADAGDADDGEPPGAPSPAASMPRQRVLDVLPEDERRVLEPVLSSPGITQVALRDRSEFSKSKVSQTVSDLEKRGLLYRERQGRTYRVYPTDELAAT
jgi:hypothetical protein